MNLGRWIAAAAVGVSSMIASAPAAGAQSYAPPVGELRPLVLSIAHRLATADPVASAKWGTEKRIDDPAREREVLSSVGEQARGAGLDPGRVESMFRAQIDANKDVQRGLFAYWQVVPGTAPDVRPDLASVRSSLDSLNRDIVDRIAAQRSVLAGPGCLPDLVSAAADVVAVERIDALHQVALVRALGAVCGPVAAA
ncbi:chorismate mutase [Rhodococcus sp. ACT016]|uniref:chorismate mutase n=1 Tax=Rhodococcus sp. ACT016 TaxID=3134808 RepID=UPI003D2970A0